MLLLTKLPNPPRCPATPHMTLAFLQCKIASHALHYMVRVEVNTLMQSFRCRIHMNDAYGNVTSPK